MCIYGDADLPEREQQQQWQQHHQPMIICVCTMCLFRYMMVCSRERAIDRRVYVCLGTFSIRWMKKIQIVIFCHIQQYISIAIRYFLRLGGSHIRFDSIVHPPRIHIRISSDMAMELSKMEFPSFRLCVASGDTLLRLLFCAICAIQLLCTHHLSHQVCVMIKPFYYKFVFGRLFGFLI